MPRLERYRQFGGVHPETAALTNVLAAQGVLAVTEGRPMSEAMTFGIGGGLGMGYILWEFGEHRGQRNARVLVVAFQHSWQYSDRFVEAICRRLRVRYRMLTTGSARVARVHLDEALARSGPVVAWVDGASMPYLQLPEPMKGHYAHVVAVCGEEAGDVLVDDRAVRPFAVPGDVLAEARARIPSFRHRLLMVHGPGEADLDAAIADGIADCAANLGSGSASFSLAALRKWARLMTDGSNPKGWPAVFADRRGLYDALSAVFESVAVHGAPGGLRGLYADFLLEAAGVAGNPRLREPAERYAALAGEWDALADAALPDSVPAFRRTKEALRARQEVQMQGGDAWRSTEPLTAELRAIGAACDADFPLDDRETSALLSALRARLEAIHAAEVEALATLTAAARPGSA